VRRWVLHLDNDETNRDFARLALVLVGHSVPTRRMKKYWIMQQMILLYAERCSCRIQEDSLLSKDKAISDSVVMDSFHRLGILYSDQGKLNEAESMLDRALEDYEKALGRDHTSTLDTVNNLGLVYKEQGKLGEAEGMLDRALEGFQAALGPAHQKTQTVKHDLQLLHSSRGEGPPNYEFVCRSPNRNR
jgi:tetratricopeptide (TPR) repeat protein